MAASEAIGPRLCHFRIVALLLLRSARGCKRGLRYFALRHLPGKKVITSEELGLHWCLFRPFSVAQHDFVGGQIAKRLRVELGFWELWAAASRMHDDICAVRASGLEQLLVQIDSLSVS